MEPVESKVVMSSLVWVIMFSTLMTFSIIANAFYISSFFSSNRKPTVIHLLIFFFFLINLIEYLSLVLDWSNSSNSSTSGRSASLCSMFMFLTQFTAILHSSTTLMLVYFIYFPVTRSLSTTTLILRTSLVLLASLLLSTLASAPAILFSGLDSRNVCSLSVSDKTVFNQTFLLFYNSVLPYLLPLTLLSLPLARMLRLMNSPGDKEGMVTITVVTVTSFIVFYTPHASLIFIKDILRLGLFPVSDHSMWIVKILQSLFLLITYFFHVFRPLACFLLDPELEIKFKKTHHHQPVPVYKI